MPTPARKKIVYVVSDIDKALSFEWTVKKLKDHCHLSFILIGKKKSQLSLFLAKESVPFFEVGEVPNSGWISKWMKVFRLLVSIKPDIVHTHLWRANLLGLSASWILRVKKRIYTRHHALVHYREFKKGRIGDLLCNFWATDIIAISKNIQNILMTRDRANDRKITLIHHGFDLNYFEDVTEARIHAIRSKYHLDPSALIVGVIARYQEWKGIQFVIPAFEKLLADHPQAHLVLANATGNYNTQIQDVLRTLSKDKFTEISFESDLAALYRLFNVYVHAPIDSDSEAFGQTYVEALASGVPSVFTLSGVATEFIANERNALVVPFQNAPAIYRSLLRILNEPQLREKLIYNGRKSVASFSVENMVANLLAVYLK